jgi:hypothetical protein
VDVRINADHCGGCNQPCMDGVECKDGKCALVCGAGSKMCGATCVDVQIDPAHCGACDHACAFGEVCSQGKCAKSCHGGSDACSGSCVDLQIDPGHCGKCGNKCNKGEICSSGKCAVACSGGLSVCNGGCVDLQANPAHCGKCQSGCAASEKCLSGVCCQAGESNCSGGCANLLDSEQHCGKCGASCAVDEICIAGNCSVKKSCRALLDGDPKLADGVYSLDPDGPGGASPFAAYCDMSGGGWTLVARFGNGDAANWMLGSGHWWYDKISESGAVLTPFQADDMIARGFWSVAADELKLARSDFAKPYPVAQSKGQCLGNKTFRTFITSFGDFRNQAPWGNDSAAGICSADYLNAYKTTFGFSRVDCKGGQIGGADKLGFWVDWGSSGAVILLGAGGSACGDASSGIGTSLSPAAKLGTGGDVGHEGKSNDPGYGINLFVR